MGEAKVRTLRRLVLTCEGCGLRRTFAGRTVREVMQDIDRSGWHVYPDDNHRMVGRCRRCWEEWRDEE